MAPWPMPRAVIPTSYYAIVVPPPNPLQNREYRAVSMGITKTAPARRGGERDLFRSR